MLKLFAAAARARIVTPYLGPRAHGFGFSDSLSRFIDHVAGLGVRFFRWLTEGLSFLVHGILRQIPQELLEGHQAGGAAEDIPADLRLNAHHEFLKGLEGLRFVLDQRIALTIRPEANGVAQAVHVIKMFLPKLV